MIPLKEQISADIDNVFFNPDDFGEEHQIGFSSLLVVVDDDLLAERQASEGQGLSADEKLFFVKESGFRCEYPTAASGSPIIFDGRQYTVITIHGEGTGVLEIRVGQNRGY